MQKLTIMGKENPLVACCALTIIATILMNCQGYGAAGKETKLIVLEDEACRIEFDADTGGLRSIINHGTHDPCLKGGGSGAMPFRIYADLVKEFEIGLNEKFQLVFEDPEAITKKVLTAENSELMEVRESDGLMAMRFRNDGLEIELDIVLKGQSGLSDWSLA